MTSEARSTPRAHHPRQPSRMRLFVSGGTGVLGRGLRPLAATAGHELVLPTHDQFDLFDPTAVAAAIRDADGVLHLATRIRPLERRANQRSIGPAERAPGRLARKGSEALAVTDRSVQRPTLEPATRWWEGRPTMRYATERDNGRRMREHLGTGGPFPDLELPDHTGSLRRLSELAAGDPLFLNFYRGFWWPKEQAF